MSPSILNPEEVHLRSYLAAQVKGLHRLLEKLTGSPAIHKCEQALLDLAARRGWRVSLAEGTLTYEAAVPSVDVYTSLLEQFASSVMGILGTKIVVDEMHRIDQAAGPDIRRSADRAGLTTVFIKYL